MKCGVGVEEEGELQYAKEVIELTIHVVGCSGK